MRGPDLPESADPRPRTAARRRPLPHRAAGISESTAQHLALRLLLAEATGHARLASPSPATSAPSRYRSTPNAAALVSVLTAFVLAAPARTASTPSFGWADRPGVRRVRLSGDERVCGDIALEPCVLVGVGYAGTSERVSNSPGSGDP